MRHPRMEFKEFISAVFDTWVEKVGIILTLAPFIEKIPRVRKWLSEKPLIDRFVPLLWGIGCTCIVWGFYGAWLNEHHARIAAQTRLDVLTKPNLSGTFVEMFSAKTGEHKQDCLASIVVQLENLGAPTALEESKFTVTRESKSHEGIFLPISSVRLFDSKGVSLTFHADDHLFKKAASAAIQTNVPVQSFFQVLMRGMSRDDFVGNGTTISLCYKDVATGTSHCIQHIMKNERLRELIDVRKLGRESRQADSTSAAR